MNVLLIVLCHTRPTYTPGHMDDLATPIFLLQSPLQRRAVQPWQQRLDPYAEPMPQQRPACFCRVTALSAHRMDRYNSAAHLNQACCDVAAASRSRCQQRSPARATSQSSCPDPCKPGVAAIVIDGSTSAAVCDLTPGATLAMDPAEAGHPPLRTAHPLLRIGHAAPGFSRENAHPPSYGSHMQTIACGVHTAPWVLVIIFEIRVTSLRCCT